MDNKARNSLWRKFVTLLIGVADRYDGKMMPYCATLIAIIVVSALGGCSAPNMIRFRTTNVVDEIIISKELNAFLNSNTKPTVVIRVPVSTTNVTTKEREGRLTEVYNEMEKALVKAGFTVRDRGLLNNLLANSSTSSQADYEEIGKKIQTDLIIEMIDIDFDRETYEDVDSGFSVRKNRMITLDPKARIHLWRGKMQAKIIIVSKGQNGGYLTFNYTPCTEGCTDEYVEESNKGRFPTPIRADDRVVFKHFSDQLIKALNNALLAK